MKKVLLSLIFLLTTGLFAIGQTAVDFSANDCNGNSHHLFADLDAGKVVVITFVMPCISCIGPAQHGSNMVQEYAASNPGKVIFYMADNHGSPACSVLTSWANTNNLAATTYFSDTSLRITDYGAMAMNKTVVLVGTNHRVVFTQDYDVDTNNLKAAINEAIINPTSVSEVNTGNAGIRVYPNPANNSIFVSYTLSEAQSISIDVVNLIGKTIKTVTLENSSAGQNTVHIDLKNEIPNGIYFIRLNAGKYSETTRFTISR